MDEFLFIKILFFFSFLKLFFHYLFIHILIILWWTLLWILLIQTYGQSGPAVIFFSSHSTISIIKFGAVDLQVSYLVSDLEIEEKEMKSLMKEESCDFINTTYDISLDSIKEGESRRKRWRCR